MAGFNKVAVMNDPRKITDELRQQVQTYIDSRSLKLIQDLNSVKGQLDLKLNQLEQRLEKVGDIDKSGQKYQTQRIMDNDAKIHSIEEIEYEQLQQLAGFKKEVEDILLLKDQVRQLSDMVMNSDKQFEQFNTIMQQFQGLQKENLQLQKRIGSLEERLNKQK